MRKIRALWQFAFDVRPGERLRVLYISLYLLCVLWAYYILKPVSRAMFLHRFNIDDLPWLYILIAIAGGILATLYTRVAVRASLTTAVTWATVASVACLVAIWWVLQYPFPWMLYVFNVWVSLFSIVVVTQGWLVAANVFDSREAKRLYGLIGLSPVIGAAFGGSFTTFALQFTGEPRHLLLASAIMVLLAYGSFRCLLLLKGVSLTGASAVEGEEANFSVMEILAPLRTHRHLQVIMAITMVMFIVDTSIDYQFNAMAKARFSTQKDLAAFMGTFNGIYLNAVNFTLQFFLSAIVVRWLGVGGVLQIMPLTISAAAAGSLVSPSLGAAATAKLSESALRYTFNKTAMELLYLPLPTELKNRTKAFVDIFVDRLGRGIGGVLILVATGALGLATNQVPYLTLAVAAIWAVLAWHAQKEYFRTVRGRMDSRRLTLEDARITVNDPAMVKMLEQAAASANPRQATYALGLLAEAPGYRLEPLLARLARSPLGEVRRKAYELAASSKSGGLVDSALEETRTAGAASQAAANYVLTVSPDAETVAREFLDAPDCGVVRGAIFAIAANTKLAELVPHDWILKEASSSASERRALAALGYGIRARAAEPPEPEILYRLIVDRDAAVASEACRVAGWTRNRAFVHPLVERLPQSPVRAAAIEGLAAYGAGVCGTLGDLLADDSVPLAVRRQIPRVLKMVPDQRSVDVLLANIDQRDLRLRHAVLKGLNRLRESAPDLLYNGQVVNTQILNEARRYFELHAALAHLRETAGPRSAADLLARTIDERLGQILERLFRLLGLRYPHREIYASYLAIQHRRTDEFSAAIEFLDNVLDRDLKKIIIPMLDHAGPMTARGRDLFGVEVPDVETALKSLIRTGDPWLVACAVATAAEQMLRGLAPDVREAAERNETEVAQVARSAAAALA